MKFFCFFANLSILLFLSSCSVREPKAGPIATSQYVAPSLHDGTIGRIVLMPFEHQPKVGSSARQLDAFLAATWRSSGMFEVIQATPTQRSAIFTDDALSRNEVNSRQLHECRITFRADAVLLGRVEEWTSYDPIAIGLQASLISCRDGSVIWSAGGHFDGQTKSVQQEVEQWYYRTIGREQRNISGWRTTLMSPRLFLRFVSDRLVADALALAPR